MSKIQGKLEDQILNKIGLLLDKPISPKSTKEILELIGNCSSAKQKIFYLIQTKFRGELILHMLQNYPYLVAETVVWTISNLLKNIMKYEEDMVKQLWKLLMEIMFTKEQTKPNQTQELIYKLGYQDLLKEGLKVTNLEKKNIVFGLIQSNVQIFSALGLKDNLRKVIGTFVECFRKFPITVPNYVKIIRLIVKMIRDSNQSKQEKQPQGVQEKQDDIKLQKLPLINDEYMAQILTQLNNILQSTKQKPLHLLHNECLIAMDLVISYAGNNVLKNDSVYSINKTLQVYLYRKGTRDEARKVSLAVQKVQNYIELSNRQKMAKQYSESNFSQQINQNPVLIENVISKTNQFLAKYHVNNIAGNLSVKGQESQIFLKNSRFLKRGDGVGGGKALLEIKSGGESKIAKKMTKENLKKSLKKINIKLCSKIV